MSTRLEEALAVSYLLDGFTVLVACSSSFLYSSSFRLWDLSLGRGRTGRRQQVIGEDTQPHPTFHAGLSTITAAGQPVPSLQGADPPFTSGRPAHGLPEPALPSMRPSRLRQAPALGGWSHTPHSTLLGLPFVGRRCPAASAVANRSGRPNHSSCRCSDGCHRSPVGHPLSTDLVIGKELGLGLLHLDQLAEFGGLQGLPLANSFAVGSNLLSTLCVSPSAHGPALAPAPARSTRPSVSLAGRAFSPADAGEPPASTPAASPRSRISEPRGALHASCPSGGRRASSSPSFRLCGAISKTRPSTLRVRSRQPSLPTPWRILITLTPSAVRPHR